MSKLFDALRKAQGEVSDIALDIIEQAGAMPEVHRADNGSALHDDPDDLEIPLVAIRPPAPGLVLPFEGASRVGEQYRIIRTKLIHHPAQPRVIVISSPGPGDGKTLTAINLAGVLALRENGNVLLLDADFRRPNVAYAMGLEPAVGAGDVLSGGSGFRAALRRVESLPNLHVMTAGTVRRNPAELLDSNGWRDLVACARRDFRFVVVDAPPVETVADYELIQAVCDGVVIVVRPDHTKKADCAKALEQVPKGKLLGVVMNHVEDWVFSKSRGYYYYSGQEPS